ncbi:MAG: ComEA family DNA-binding protein [Oscillochloris sp.]|nr:ComEA family DNA-binding protein [Oscillochloris sp.]
MQLMAEAWWRKPRLLAAATCAALGVAVLLFGPQLRGATAEEPPPAAAMLEPGLIEADPFGDPFGAAIEPTSPPQTPQPDLIVYVSGAVAAPDVYRLPAQARLKDAVLAAGGLRADADPHALNLAATLSDAQHIHVPVVGETPALPVAESTVAGAGQSDQRIDLNLAGEAELEELPGVGKTIAARIVERRITIGPYTSIDELRDVSGVGEKLFTQIEPFITVGP